MAKFRSWNKELKCFIRFKNGRYYIENIKGFKGYKGKGSYSYYFNWQNAQRYLFTNKFRQDIYVGSTLEGTILGSKVKVVVEEDNFGIAHARCIDCKSTENSESFNLNDIDILWCYNLKVLEDKLMENE